ncbi:MAG: UDP-N-acetylglucosamine--N-acetylmuramyl-(pentapeptide) pyrophosphoryl-undecaprenol N-acetylglucosamine transferase [Candidatus Omnitrophota bacterium]
MRVLIVTGASGGHIFPAVSFIQALKEKDSGIDALLVLPERGLKPGVSLGDCKIKYISTATITAGITPANILALAKFLKGAWESFNIIIEFKPDLVVGFGSLDSIPCVLIAWFFRIKTMIHEQNVLPGKANRLLARFVDRVAVSFAESEYYFSLNRQKLTLTGNPLRKQIKKIDKARALDFFGLAKDKFTILVMGGSRGSRNINSGFLKAVSKLGSLSAMQVIHLAGSGDFEDIKESYRRMNLSARVFDFLGDIEQAYSASDLVVSRAGATSISELIFFEIPAVISPYPFAYAHQLKNASILKDKGCAIVISDDELDKDILKLTFQALVNDRVKLESMRLGFSSLSGGSASDLLVDAALSLK